MVLTVLYIAHNDAASRRRQGTPSSPRHDAARALTDAGRRRGAAEDPAGRLGEVVVGKSTAGWALRRNVTVHGLSDPMDYFRMAPELLARRY